MKIVQSYWSKPNKSFEKGFQNKISGGWRNIKYQYMSWALSCLKLKTFYPNIELVTDLEGKRILIEQLGLPYDNVRIELDNLNKYPVELWALGKLYTYALQNEPFIHVDNDVFIWEKFNNQIEKAELIGQHVDNDEDHYHHALKHLKELNIKLPSFLINDFEKNNKFNASNAGIIGGSNVCFFKEYVNEAFHLINSQLGKINKSLFGTSYAIIYEQYLYSAMARKNQIKISHLFEADKSKKNGFSEFYE